MIIIFVIMTILIDPFKSTLNYLSSSILIFILLIACFCASFIGAVMAEERGKAITSYSLNLLPVKLSFLPLFYVAIIAMHWIRSHLRLHDRLTELGSRITT